MGRLSLYVNIFFTLPVIGFFPLGVSLALISTSGKGNTAVLEHEPSVAGVICFLLLSLLVSCGLAAHARAVLHEIACSSVPKWQHRALVFRTYVGAMMEFLAVAIAIPLCFFLRPWIPLAAYLITLVLRSYATRQVYRFARYKRFDGSFMCVMPTRAIPQVPRSPAPPNPIPKRGCCSWVCQLCWISASTIAQRQQPALVIDAESKMSVCQVCSAIWGFHDFFQEAPSRCFLQPRPPRAGTYRN